MLAQFEGMKYFSICHKKDIADIFSTLMTVLYGKGQLPRCKRTPLFTDYGRPMKPFFIKNLNFWA
jgi:hypothetical protein